SPIATVSSIPTRRSSDLQGVHQDTLTTFFNSRMVDIGAYFNPDEGTQHAIASLHDGSLAELYWYRGYVAKHCRRKMIQAKIICRSEEYTTEDQSQEAIVA